MSDHYLRRTVLSAAAALGLGGTAVASGDDDDDETTVSQSQRVTVEQEQHVIFGDDNDRCSKCGGDHDESTHKTVSETYPVGTVKLENKSNCTRNVLVGVSEKFVNVDGRTETVALGPGEKAELEFIGSINRVDAEPGKIAVCIYQDSEWESNTCGSNYE